MDEPAQTNRGRTTGAFAGAALLPAAPASWGSRAPRPRPPLNKALVGNAPRREVLRSAAALAAGLLLGAAPVATAAKNKEVSSMDYDVFALGDVQLLSGTTLPNAVLAYKTHGTLAADRHGARRRTTYPLRRRSVP